MKSCPKIYEFSKKPYPKICIPYKVYTLKFNSCWKQISNDGSIIGDAENDTPKFMTTYNLTKNDSPKFISCSKKGTPKNGTSRTSIYGSYPPPGVAQDHWSTNVAEKEGSQARNIRRATLTSLSPNNLLKLRPCVCVEDAKLIS